MRANHKRRAKTSQEAAKVIPIGALSRTFPFERIGIVAAQIVADLGRRRRQVQRRAR